MGTLQTILRQDRGIEAMEKVFEIATRISTPLMLAGFLAAAFFLVLRQVLRTQFFSVLTPQSSATIIRIIIERLFLLALIAMLLGFAGYVMTTVARPTSNTPAQQQPHGTGVPSQQATLVSVGPSANPGSAFSDLLFQIYSDEESSYSIFINVVASFRSDAFNRWPYLRSLREIRVSKLPQRDAKARAFAHDDEQHEAYLDRRAGARFRKETPPLPSMPGAREITWSVYLKLREKPRSTDTFDLQTGPLVWEIKFGELGWIQHRTVDSGGEKRWWGARASLRLLVRDPDWVVLHSARLVEIAARRNTGGKESLLEAVVENLSPSTLAASELMLIAIHDKGFACRAPGARPAPVQRLTLKWPRILSRSGTLNPSASVSLGEDEVIVPIEYRPASCANNYHLSASIPVRLDVPSKDLLRAVIKVTEIPLESTDGSPPASLANWDGVFLSIRPPGLVFPDHVLVYLR